MTQDEVGDIARFDGIGKLTKTSVDTTTSLRVPPTVEVAKFDGKTRRFRVELDEGAGVATVAYREGGTIVANGVYSLLKGLPRIAALQDIAQFGTKVSCEVAGGALVPKVAPTPWDVPL